MNRKTDISTSDAQARAEIDRLMASVPDAEQAGLREVWDLVGDAPPISSSVASRSWSGILSQIAAEPARQPVKRLRTPLRLPALRLVSRLSIAASIALFLALTYSLRPSESVYSAAEGESGVTVALRDGSVVRLASGSILRVADAFGQSARDVKLDGEAFFDVSSATLNNGLPFKVETFNASVEVLGTAFNVRARESEWEATTSVAVEHGSVRVASADVPEMSIVLEPGEGSSVDTGSTPSVPESVDLVRAFAWRSGGLAFVDEPMGAVFDELQRRYDIEIEASAVIRAIPVSYWRESNVGVDEMLADLADVLDVRFRRTSSGYTVFETDQ